MSVLVIGETEQAAIAEALAKARAKPVPWEVAQHAAIDDRDNPTTSLMLSDRPDQTLIKEIREDYPTQMVELGSYIIALSFEQQPASLMRHLSIAARDPKLVPNRYAIRMVLQAFGFAGYEAFGTEGAELPRPCRAWVEEYAPGRHAINFLELDEEPPGGHA